MLRHHRQLCTWHLQTSRSWSGGAAPKGQETTKAWAAAAWGKAGTRLRHGLLLHGHQKSGSQGQPQWGKGCLWNTAKVCPPLNCLLLVSKIPWKRDQKGQTLESGQISEV